MKTLQNEEREIKQKVKQTVKFTIDSKGLSELGLSEYVSSEAQRKIDKLGLKFSIADAIKEGVKFKTPYNILYFLSNTLRWTDKAKKHCSEKYREFPRLVTVELLVEWVLEEDPKSIVVMGEYYSEVMKYDFGDYYMLKNIPSDNVVKVIFDDHVHPAALSEVSKIVMLHARPAKHEFDENYRIVFGSKRGDKKEVIKWLFETVAHDVEEDKDGNDLDLMLLYRDDMDYPEALEILRKYAELIDVDDMPVERSKRKVA